MSSAGVLGKRKRKATTKVESEPDPSALEDAQAIFRKHFEAQFAPIQDRKQNSEKGVSKGKMTIGDGQVHDDANGPEDMRSESESDQDAWDGVSGDEDSEENDDDEGDSDDDTEYDPKMDALAVQVVDHSKPLPSSTVAPQLATMSKRESRAYLSSRPPDATADDHRHDSKKSKQNPGEKDDPHNEDSKTLLANDLELQRLINESHILSASNPFNSIGSRTDGASGKTFVEGRTRALTTDLRLQALGSKASILKQRNMPMGMRKGINAAKDAREEKRRREARENGIVLEKDDRKGKSGGKKKKSKGRGDVAVDMPGMGRFKGGELKLSKSEVRAVEMEGMRMDYGGKKRRRRR